jgi:hypothetical protein
LTETPIQVRAIHYTLDDKIIGVHAFNGTGVEYIPKEAVIDGVVYICPWSNITKEQPDIVQCECRPLMKPAE